MSGKKGTEFPVNEKQMAAAESFVAKATEELANVMPMKKAERMRVVKLKIGTSFVVPAITKLIKKYELETKHVSMDESESLFAYSDMLRSLLSPVSTLEQLIKDEILRAEAAAWTSITVSYGMLSEVSIAVPDLRRDLKPIERWFGRGHAAGKPAAAPAHAPAVAVAAENPAPKA